MSGTMEYGACDHDQLQIGTTIKIEEEGPTTSTVYVDSKIDLNHLKQEPGLVQSVKSEPMMLVKKEIAGNSNEAATMEHGASRSIKKQLQTEMTINTVTVHTDSEIKPHSWKPESVFVHSVKSEPALLVNEEILEDSSHDSSDQQCVYDSATPVGSGGVNETCSTSLDDLVNVKHEWADIDIGPTVLQRMDIYYTINKQNVSPATEENSIGDDCSEAMPGSGVKKGSAEDKWGDSLAPQNTIMKERSVREHQLASYCKVLVMTLNVFQCDICHAVYTDKLRLLQHLQSMHTCRPWTSLVAKVNKTNKRTAEGYISSCFRCTACGKIFSKAHLMRAHRHRKLHERNGATSGATSSSVAGPSNVQRSEAATKAEPKPFKCDVCKKRYSSEVILSQHKRFNSGVGLSVCRICGAKFNLKSKLKMHLRENTGEKPFQCDTCDARFTTSSYLTRHKRVHSGEKPFQCGTCDARFTTSSYLTIHKRVHSGEKPFQCDTCNARFINRSHLTRHKRLHSGEKPFQCDTCNARFTNSSHLTSHKRVHTGEKPYQCDTCNASFSKSTNLTRHQRVHTGEKPYQCATCNARFTTNCELTRHKRVHTGEKPFECTECGSKFTQRCSLNKHVRRRHPK